MGCFSSLVNQSSISFDLLPLIVSNPFELPSSNSKLSMSCYVNCINDDNTDIFHDCIPMTHHIIKCIDKITQQHPYAGVMVQGDFNRLKDDSLRSYPLTQLVHLPTRKQAVLDKYIAILKIGTSRLLSFRVLAHQITTQFHSH